MNADDDGATTDVGVCGWPPDEWFIDREWGDDRPVADTMQCTAGPSNAPGDDH